MNKIQSDQVIEVMEKNKGYATLGFLYEKVDVSNWKTKTPDASIRRIVQNEKIFFKIKPGLWALKAYKNKLSSNLEDLINSKENEKAHSYYQGLLLEIGNFRKYDTFAPNQDKNKMFLEKKLFELRTIEKMYEFGYLDFIKKAQTIDVSWFKEKMPYSFFEVEHSTDMYKSLIKFDTLKYFNCSFYIVANKKRKEEYNDKIGTKIFHNIRKRTNFLDYDSLSKLYRYSKLYNKSISQIIN